MSTKEPNPEGRILLSSTIDLSRVVNISKITLWKKRDVFKNSFQYFTDKNLGESWQRLVMNLESVY